MAKISWLYGPGEKIQNFTILSRLGAGGMGQVYLCRDDGLNRNIAIKVLPKSADGDDEVEIRRFIQEGRLLAQINHPNISAIHSIGENELGAFLVMEYIKGESLHTLIREGRLNFHEKIKILQGVALGLHEAHRNGIVHRDIKPANILVDQSGRAKLIDFGIAKAMFSKNEVTTETGAVIGTMNYIAPEIFSGSFPSIQSDIYALGLVLFEMVTGTLPFEGPSRLTVLENIRTRNLKYPSEYEPLLPKDFFRLIVDSTDPLPEKRLGSATNFHSRLEQIDLSHIPSEFMLSLRPLNLSNRDSVLQALEQSGLVRALWPLAISKSTYLMPAEENKPSEGKTMEIENEVLSLSNEAVRMAVVDVNALCSKCRNLDLERKQQENARPTSTASRRYSNLELAVVGTLVFAGIFLVGRFGIDQLRRGTLSSQEGGRELASLSTENEKAKNAPIVLVDRPAPVPAVVQDDFASLEKKYPSVGLYKDGETDAWPAIPMANLRIGTKVIYRNITFFAIGKGTMNREIWELVGFEGNNLVWKTQEIDKDGKLLYQPWRRWHRNNAQFTADTKGEESREHPAFESVMVGNPEDIFPMRKGRVVVHEVFSEMSLHKMVNRMRSISIVRDWETVSTAIGVEKTIRIDSYFETGTTPDVIYYSPTRQLIVLWRGPKLAYRGYEIVKELEAVLSEGSGQDFATHLKNLNK